jgi:hypothetical protein
MINTRAKRPQLVNARYQTGAAVAVSRGIIGLDLPEQRYANGASFYTQPRKVEQWIAGLPRAHVGESSRLLYNALRDMNELALPVERRIEVLEALRTPVFEVVAAMRQHVLGQAFPLSPRKHKVGLLIREMLGELATGFKVVAETAAAQGSDLLRNEALRTAIYRAVECDHSALLNIYQTYSPYPAGAWQQLHTLFGFAYTHGTAALPVKNVAAPNNTIEDIYKQALLLALVNPYQLSQDDTQRIYESLPYWSASSALKAAGAGMDCDGLFAADLDRDQPPAYFSYCPVERGKCFVLDTHPLTQQLRDLLAGEARRANSVPQVVASLSHDTLRRMLLSWGLLSKRNFPRRGQHAQVNITLGLTATHKFLAARTAPLAPTKADAPRATGPAVFKSLPVVGADGSGRYPEVWELTTPASKGAVATAPRTTASGGGKNKLDQTDVSVRPHVFNITNESAGGYCLLWNQGASGTLVVGDLLCVHQSPDPGSICNICVVRWMKSVGDKMVLGVEILSPCAEPVLARSLAPDQIATAAIESLVLPPLRAVSRPSTLITSCMWGIGDILSLTTPSGAKQVRLTSLQQTTRSFKEFQFIDYHPEQPPASEESPGFESIWSSL